MKIKSRITKRWEKYDVAYFVLSLSFKKLSY